MSVHLIRTEVSLYTFKNGCWFMQSTYENGIKTTFGQLDQKLPKTTFGPMDQKFKEEKITEITFSPMDQKWSYFYAGFYKSSIRDRSFATTALVEAFQKK